MWADCDRTNHLGSLFICSISAGWASWEVGEWGVWVICLTEWGKELVLMAGEDVVGADKPYNHRLSDFILPWWYCQMNGVSRMQILLLLWTVLTASLMETKLCGPLFCFDQDKFFLYFQTAEHTALEGEQILGTDQVICVWLGKLCNIGRDVGLTQNLSMLSRNQIPGPTTALRKGSEGQTGPVWYS